MKRNIKIKKRKIRKIKFVISKFIGKLTEIFKDFNTKSSFNLLEVLLISFISIIFGLVIGYVITNNRNALDSNVDEIVNTYSNIKENYYDKIDDKQLSDAAIKGMLDFLDDPYSTYMNLKMTDSFNESIDGAFVGIGISVVFSDDHNVVVDIFENSPAEKSGIQVGDILLEVNNKNVVGLYGDELTSLIRGKVGTKVKLLIKRNKEEKSFIVKREKIEIKNVFSQVIKHNDENIGYLSLKSFAANSSEQFKKELGVLENKNITSLIIDVRNNPGGHLLQVRKILSMFFDKNTLLYQIESKGSKEKVYSLNNDKKNYPVAILINKNSASASEILASAFQDNYKNALIIGENSYGKGSIQKTNKLSDGTSIKFTTQKWLTSKGKWLNEKGVKPDVEVVLNENYLKNPIQSNDNQLQKTLEQLEKLK